MKVSGPGSGVPPEATGEAAEAEKPGGKGFAEKLHKSDEAAPPGQADAPAAARPLTGDLGAKLQASEISPQTAVDKVIVRIVDRQLGTDAPPAIRAQVEAALRDALESDPMLLEKVKSLSKG
jgi:hypothetical protein